MAQIDQDLIDQLRVFGPESATALARRLAVSTPTVTRALKRLGDAVIAVGKGRASAYALRRHVRDLGHSWPLYKIGPDAEPVQLGTLQALQGRYRWRLAPEHPLPLFMRGEFAEGLYEDLPWFLFASRPSGYLGREFGRFFGAEVGAPDDIRLWQGDDILAGALSAGLDLPGNLIIGERTVAKLGIFEIISKEIAVSLRDRGAAFTASVQQDRKKDVFASSAAGERPKFTHQIVCDGSECTKAIVKFASLVQGNPAAQRWADLLICEAFALHQLHAQNFQCAGTEIFEINEWLFLQSSRFDRTPLGGRIGVFNLEALDTAYAGSDLKSWLSGALPLHAQGMIDADDIETIRLLDAFGRLIGNDDMHHGNLSFFAEPESEQLKLAPVYDMLPMHYRPSPTGLTHDRPFPLPTPDPAHAAVWEKAGAMALAFWTTAAADPRLSADFAAICAGNAERIAAWRDSARG